MPTGCLYPTDVKILIDWNEVNLRKPTLKEQVHDD